MKMKLGVIGLWFAVLMGCGGGGSSNVGTTDVITYKFDETTGTTAFNSSSTSFNGTIYGANRIVGKSNNALHFGSPGSRVEINMNNSIIIFEEDTMSIDAWIKLDSIQPGSVYQIIGDGYYGLKSFRFQINDGHLQMLLFDGYGWQTIITGNQSLSANAWHHIAFTYNGTTANTYIDGNIDNSFNITSKILSVYNTLFIGNMDSDVNGPSDFQNQFMGTIDELRISKDYRTAAEINTYYLATK